ncbi:MAG: hypothetical protein ABMA14_14465 [Hyphomonadaceae bacterium]
MAVLALIAFVVSPSLMLGAIWMALRTPGLKFRWVRCLAALTAVSQWGFNTATGASKFVALHGALVGAVITPPSAQHDGWTLKSAIPLGAVVVIALLWRRSKKLEVKAAQDTSPT